MLEQALQYLNKGYSVVAAREDGKRPLSNWTEFQKRLPTIEEVKKWFTENKTANLGFITGSISGFFVLDIEASVDVGNFIKEYALTTTAVAKTGGNGWHYYYKCPIGIKVPTKARIFGKESKWAVDIRGDGGFVVAPPSVHPTTKKT